MFTPNKLKLKGIKLMVKVILDPKYDSSAKNKVKYKMRSFNTGKLLETAIGKLGWLIVVVAALALSFWSLFYVARHYGLPLPLATIVSCCFDGAAIVCADLALKYARSYGDSGLAPRIAVFVLAGASAYLNSQHAVLAHDPKAAVILYASPPIIAVMLFELHSRYERRNALRKTGRVAKTLPVFGRWSWILFPIRSYKMMRGIVKRRLNQFDEQSINESTVANVLVMAEARQVRAWAASQGFIVGDRGRIPGEIMAAFQAKQAELTVKVEDSNDNVVNLDPNKSISPILENDQGELDA